VSELIYSYPLEFMPLVVVDIEVPLAAREDDFRPTGEAPLAPGTIVELSPRRHARVELVRPIHELAQLGECLPQYQRPIVGIRNRPLSEAERIDYQGVGLAATGRASIQHFILGR
jgi:hypothetical protein